MRSKSHSEVNDVHGEALTSFSWVAAPEAWLLDDFSWRGEWLPHAVLENERLVLIQDTRVHDRTVLVLVHVHLEALVGLAPIHLKCCLLLTPHWTSKPIKHIQGLNCILVVCEVDKGIAEGSVCPEVGRRVHKVVLARQTRGIEHVHHHDVGAICRHVLNHQ